MSQKEAGRARIVDCKGDPMAVKKTLRTLIADQKILQTDPRTTVLEASRQMTQRDVGATLVQDGGKLVGIFTERDLLKRVVSASKDPSRTTLADVMTPSPMTIEADEGVPEAMIKMREARCRHLPVMDHGKLLGILSMRDILMRVLELREEQIKSLEDYVDYLPPDTSPGG